VFDLTGKTILVTGASKGIGAAIVEVLGRQGANVVAHYGSDRAGAEAATASIPGDRLRLVAADLAKPGAAGGLWRNALAWKQRIDVFVNNAAIMAFEGGIDDQDGAREDGQRHQMRHVDQRADDGDFHLMSIVALHNRFCSIGFSCDFRVRCG
jgi:NAD(P)-dependent dehydrogenase (short-subunit alcohol dehydrogenase family)